MAQAALTPTLLPTPHYLLSRSSLFFSLSSFPPCFTVFYDDSSLAALLLYFFFSLSLSLFLSTQVFRGRRIAIILRNCWYLINTISPVCSHTRRPLALEADKKRERMKKRILPSLYDIRRQIWSEKQEADVQEQSFWRGL